MKIRLLSIVLLTGLIVSSCGNKKQEPKETEMTQETNPFFMEWDTPFGVPPFEKIKEEHYMPAFERAMEEHVQEIKTILETKDAATFANTIEAYENSGVRLRTISEVFFNLNSANTNDKLDKIAQEIAPKLSNHSDNILLNKTLFERIKSVYENKTNFELNSEQEMLLDKTFRTFVRGGAKLSDENKERLKEINQKLSELTVQFGQNLLAETNAYKLVIDKKEDLEGLSEEQITAAAELAKENKLEGKWVFTLHNPSLMPFLQYAKNRELRRTIWEQYSKRGNNSNSNNNTQVLVETANLRNEKARILGYTSHAHYVLEETMAKNPDNVYSLLNKLWPSSQKIAQKEFAELQQLMNKDLPGEKLQAWDWRYYSEKLRTKKFDFDENELKPYFELNNVKEGIFYTVNKLYGLEFKELDDLPIYHEEVKVYRVLKKDKSTLGILYMDFHPRESKQGGAWMTSFRSQHRKNGENIIPIISIVCNFSKPTGEQPALLTFDEVTTFFHEFGHALHGLMSDVTYYSLSGTNVPSDFVELPSQILECWAAENEVLQVYAKHFQTGEIIPPSLLAKMQKSDLYGQGFATAEYLAASYLDLDYHSQTENIVISSDSFENISMNNKIKLHPAIIPRYRSTYFSHIFSGGYSAGYYSYIWSEVLDADAFEAFKTKGIFDQATADAFAENVLSKGGTVDPAELYRRFRGQDPKIDALIKRRGLK